MIKYLNKTVTYDDLKNLTLYTDHNYNNFKLISFVIGLFLAIIILYIVLSQSHFGFKLELTLSIISLFCIIISLIIPHHFKKSMIINEELNDYKPQYRNVHITSHIDDISNGSTSDDQELRFEHNGKNYYALIPSDIPVTTNDKVTIDIKEQIVDKDLNKHHLSQSVNDPKNKVTIQHRGKTYNTELITINSNMNPKAISHQFLNNNHINWLILSRFFFIFNNSSLKERSTTI